MGIVSSASNQSPSSQTLNVVLGGNFNANSGILVFIGHGGLGNTVASLSDALQTPFRKLGQSQTPTGNFVVEAWFGTPKNGASTDSISVTLASSAAVSMITHNISTSGSGVVDVVGQPNSGSSVAPNAAVSGNGPFPELGVMGVIYDAGGKPLAASGGDSLVATSDTTAFGFDSLQQSFNGSVTLSATISATVSWATIAISFTLAPNPPPPPPTGGGQSPPGAPGPSGTGSAAATGAGKLTCVSRAMKNARFI